MRISQSNMIRAKLVQSQNKRIVEVKMKFRARKCNYEQMCPPTVSLIDGRRIKLISATSISGKVKPPNPPP